MYTLNNSDVKQTVVPTSVPPPPPPPKFTLLNSFTITKLAKSTHVHYMHYVEHDQYHYHSVSLYTYWFVKSHFSFCTEVSGGVT